MTAEITLRLLELGLAFAVLQRAAEHLGRDRLLFALQAVAALTLISGFLRSQAILALWTLSLWQLYRFQGPYNGGADKLALLLVTCLGAAHLAPNPYWRDLALAYLAVQLVLSYFISGWVKLRNSDWRSGQALSDVFAFSAYPVAKNLRQLSERQRLLQAASWSVILLEVTFPIAFLFEATLVFALVLTGLFHLANAVLFGLNRFFWIWIACYPVLIWFQARVL